MKRQYYISKDLNDLHRVEDELKSVGFIAPQIHLLSENDAEAEKHHLHAIESVLKLDVVRSMRLGALVGFFGFASVLVLTYLLQWHISAAGWVPFVFLAIVMLGFCTWLGGFIGMHLPNYQFKQFQDLLQKGSHVFFVDITEDQRQALENVTSAHPSLRHAGEGDATPEWVVKSQEKFNQFMKVMP